MPWSNLFLESYFASVLDYFVLTDPRLADQVYCEYLILSCFVLKFAPVQSIFRTKFCPGLGLFLISSREKNALCSPGLGLFCTKICPGPVYF